MTRRVARITKECVAFKSTYLASFILPKNCVLSFFYYSFRLYFFFFSFFRNIIFAIYTLCKISRLGYSLRVRPSPRRIGLPGEASIISVDVSRPFYKLSVSHIRSDSHQQIGVRVLAGGGGQRAEGGGQRAEGAGSRERGRRAEGGGSRERGGGWRRGGSRERVHRAETGRDKRLHTLMRQVLPCAAYN